MLAAACRCRLHLRASLGIGGNEMTEDTDCDPAGYRRNFARHAEKLRLIGATQAELALFFGVDVATIERWAEEHKDFE